MHLNEVIVRWDLGELPGLLEEVGMKRPFAVRAIESSKSSALRSQADSTFR